MIRGRGELARRLCKRGLAAAVAALVILLVLLVGVHPISDNIVEHAELVCAAAVLVLGLSLTLGGHDNSPAGPRPPVGGARLVQAAHPVRPALVFNEIRTLPLRR